jgi:adenylylsulfate kinase
MEKPVRSLLKAISWRIVATSTTTLLVFIFTGNLIISIGVGGSEFFLKILIYYVHERVWNLFHFGREQKSKKSASLAQD